MQITIPTLQLGNFRPQGLPRATSGTCAAVVGSPNLSGNFTRWVGLEGLIVNVDGDDYTVLAVHPTVMVIDPVYGGTATSNVPFTVYPYVYLRLYPTQGFTAESDQQIIQPAAPGNGNFYKQVCGSVISNTLHLPELQLESTTDAVNPSERSSRYFAGFYRLDGSLIQPYYKFEQFCLMASPAVQTWADIAGYNSRGAAPPRNYDTYTKDQILELFDTGTFDVLPPLVFDGTTLYIPKASATQDGYVSKEDYQMFLEGMDVGISQINAGTGLTTDTGLPITDTGTVLLADIPGVEGLYTNPIIEVNAQGQIISIESGTGGPVDTDAPVITPGSIVATPTGTSVVITWTTDENSDSQVDYGTTAGPPYTTTTPFSQTGSLRTTAHSVTITSLTSQTPYHYRVRSRDAMHNMVESADLTFTTLDITAPVITPGSIVASPIGTTTVTITWDTSELSTSIVDYGTTTGYGSTASGPSGTHHVVSLTSLLAGQGYHYKVTSVDIAGNPSLPSGDFTFTTTSGVSSLLTGIENYWSFNETSGPWSDAVSGNTANAYGTPLHSTVGKNAGCVDTNSAGVAAAAGSNLAARPFTISGWMQLWGDNAAHLAPFVGQGDATTSTADFVFMYDNATTHAWRFITGAGGTVSIDLPMTVDMTGTVWYFLCVRYDGTTMRLRVNTTDATPQASAGIPSHVSGATLMGFGQAVYASTGYISPARIDEVGIWGRSLTDAEVDVLAAGSVGSFYPFGPDTTAPIITLASTPVTAITGTSATINWTTSENADSEVRYSTDTLYGTATVPPVTNTFPPGPGVTTHAVNLTGLAALTTYHYQVKSKDAAGNAATPVTGTFMTVTDLPPDLTTGLVAYWHLDETAAGPFADSVGTATLSAAGGITTVGGVHNSGQGILSNTVGIIYCLDTPEFNVTGSLSISGWINVDDLMYFYPGPPPQNNEPTLAAHWQSPPDWPANGHDWVLRWSHTNTAWEFVVTADGATEVIASVPGTPTLNQWYMWTGVFDIAAGTIKLYINDGIAIPPATATFTGPVHHGGSPFSLLQYNAYYTTYGFVDEIGIWAKALTAAEVVELWNGGAGKFHPFT